MNLKQFLYEKNINLEGLINNSRINSNNDNLKRYAQALTDFIAQYADNADLKGFANDCNKSIQEQNDNMNVSLRSLEKDNKTTQFKNILYLLLCCGSHNKLQNNSMPIQVLLLEENDNKNEGHKLLKDDDMKIKSQFEDLLYFALGVDFVGRINNYDRIEKVEEKIVKETADYLYERVNNYPGGHLKERVLNTIGFLLAFLVVAFLLISIPLDRLVFKHSHFSLTNQDYKVLFPIAMFVLGPIGIGLGLCFFRHLCGNARYGVAAEALSIHRYLTTGITFFSAAQSDNNTIDILNADHNSLESQKPKQEYSYI